MDQCSKLCHKDPSLMGKLCHEDPSLTNKPMLPKGVKSLGPGFYKDDRTEKVYDGKLNELEIVNLDPVTGIKTYYYNDRLWANPGYNYGYIADNVIKGVGRYLLKEILNGVGGT